MKKWIAVLLALSVCLMSGALGEGLAPEEVQLPVEEIEVLLGTPQARIEETYGDVLLDNDEDVEAPEIEATEAAEGVRTIHLTENTTKTVTIGLDYQIAVARNESIRRVRTSDAGVATADKDGAITLVAPGRAVISVVTTANERLALTLEVKLAAAPKKVSVASTKKKFTLSWKASKQADGYLVQRSSDGESWEDFKAVGKSATSAIVTDAVAGRTWLRVASLLGGRRGEASEAVSVLDPVENVKVICEESFLYGPTDRLNVLWEPVPHATGYAVYRAALPDGEYELIGTTKKTVFATLRSPTELHAYCVKPTWGNIDLDALPMSEPVTLWTGFQDNVRPTSDLTSPTGIILVVNKQAQCVTAYIRDSKGRYTLPLRHMICSTGRDYDRTRNGVYPLQARRGEWYTYAGPSGITIRWPSIYRSGYYFHSPLYNRYHEISTTAVRHLGSRASAGCVRLKTEDAGWVYHYCAEGTTVYICDGTPREDLRDALLPKDVAVVGFR